MQRKPFLGRRLGVALALVAACAALGAHTTRAALLAGGEYTANVDGTVDTGVPGDDGVYTGDTDAIINLLITNTSVATTLGSANVTVPSPFVVTAVDGLPYGGGATLELRNIGLAPGGSQSYSLKVAVQTCVATAPASFAIVAKDTADYSGTGNELTLVAASSDLSVALVGVCELAFVGQPKNAIRTQAITTVAYTPAGAPITVELRDAGDTGRATAASATVSLAAGWPIAKPVPALSGTSSVASAAGLATFSPGPVLSVSASAYRLTASSVGLTSSAPSNAFDVVDAQIACQTNKSCFTTATNGDRQSYAKLSDGNGAPGSLTISVNAGDTPDFECPDYPRSGRAPSQYLFTGGDGRVSVFTTYLKNSSPPASAYQVCWAAPYPFVTKNLGPATVQGVKPGTSDPLYVGLLPDCNAYLTNPPCVSDRRYASTTKITTLTVLSTSADPWRY